MQAIPKLTVEDPRAAAARGRVLDALWPLELAIRDYWGAGDDLGLWDDDVWQRYFEDLMTRVLELSDLLYIDPPDRQIGLEEVASGERVPVFDTGGNPLMQNGQRMYIHRWWAEHLAGRAAEIARWLVRNNAPDVAALDYLARDDKLSSRLPIWAMAHVVGLAGKIRHGESWHKKEEVCSKEQTIDKIGKPTNRLRT